MINKTLGNIFKGDKVIWMVFFFLCLVSIIEVYSASSLLTGLFIFWLSGMSWTNIHFGLLPSLLLAATMSSTDSASVFAILRSQKMNLKAALYQEVSAKAGSLGPQSRGTLLRFGLVKAF